MNAAENGQITITPTGDLTSFTGQNVTVSVTGFSPGAFEKVFPAIVSGDGSTASYNVGVQDFPVGGNYNFEVVTVDQSTGKVRRSAIVPETIGDSQ